MKVVRICKKNEEVSEASLIVRVTVITTIYISRNIFDILRESF